MYIKEPEPISTAYFINPTVSLCVYNVAATVSRQWLDKNVTAVTNTHIIIEELLGESFSMRSVSFKNKECGLIIIIIIIR
jgi:hypothetical protein